MFKQEIIENVIYARIYYEVLLTSELSIIVRNCHHSSIMIQSGMIYNEQAQIGQKYWSLVSFENEGCPRREGNKTMAK